MMLCVFATVCKTITYPCCFSELAAKNWIAASELSQAASILAKRSDPSSLRVSSFLALKAGEVDKCRNMALHCIQVCVNTRNQECIDRLVEEIDLPEVAKAAQNAKLRLDEEKKLTLDQKPEVPQTIAADKEETPALVTVKEEPLEEETTVVETKSQDDLGQLVNDMKEMNVKNE